jgi:hypothetical protein
LESPSNITKFSRQGDYFVSGGSDKVVGVWKSGFYDSLKEKINGTETSSGNRTKIIPNPVLEESEARGNNKK